MAVMMERKILKFPKISEKTNIKMNDNLGNIKRYMGKKDSIHSYSYKKKYEMNIIFDLFLDLFASKIVY